MNRLETDPDYVNMPRFRYSLGVLEEKYPDGAPDHVVAQALDMDEEDVPERYDLIVARLRAHMGVSTTS